VTPSFFLDAPISADLAGAVLIVGSDETRRSAGEAGHGRLLRRAGRFRRTLQAKRPRTEAACGVIASDLGDRPRAIGLAAQAVGPSGASFDF
jgi:hypothetical protein